MAQIANEEPTEVEVTEITVDKEELNILVSAVYAATFKSNAGMSSPEFKLYENLRDIKHDLEW